MPRAKKAQIAPGEPYGERQQLEAMAAAAPMADASMMPIVGDPAMMQQAAVQQATAMPPNDGILTRPDTAPNRPITAGLPSGAGPGPEALNIQNRRQQQLQRQLQLAAETTGNPKLQEMADRVGRPIGMTLPIGGPPR